MSSSTYPKIKAVAVLVAIITMVVYLPALQNDFVNWDDDSYVYYNPDICSIDFKSIKWMFTAFHALNWHPLTWLSHAVDYAVWGLNPMGHHLTSIILHGLNSFLVVILIMRLINYAGDRGEAPVITEDNRHFRNTSVIAAAVTGILFALHPVHVESVVWVSERKDVLCAFFFLLSVVSYLRYASSSHQRQKGLHYGLSLLFFILSLMSKPMAVTLPVVLIILDFYPLERLELKSVFTAKRSVLIEKVPFFILSIGSSVVTVIAQQAGGAIRSLQLHPLEERFLVGIRALGFYLYKMLWPAGLAPVYPYPSKISFLSFQYMGAFILVVCITAYCIWSWKRQKVFTATWAYYLVTLLPVLGIIQVGEQAAADRYTYLPSLGPFLLLGLGIIFIYKKVASKKYWHKTVIFVFLIFIVCLLSILTIRQIKIWKNSFILWNTEISRFPDYYIAYGGLGVAYGQNGSYKQAIKYFNRAIDLNPMDSVTYSNRGRAYGESGLHHKAMDDFKSAIKLNPQKAEFYNELGVAYEKLGDYQKAIENFDIAIKLDSLFVKAYFHRGIAYKNLGFNQYAIRDFQTAARLGHKNVQEYLKAKGLRRWH